MDLYQKQESLNDLIEKRAIELAKEIVNRTSMSMKLEDQKTILKEFKKQLMRKPMK